MTSPEFNLNPNILHRPANRELAINGVAFKCVDRISGIESHNPFIVNSYDFQAGFYAGKFEFSSPLTSEAVYDTPEAYGRHKIVASLLDKLADLPKATVIDIGSGTLDIARTIPAALRGRISMYNTDISGPWPVIDGLSALERGAHALMEESGDGHDFRELVNIQHNFNTTPWPFVADSADVIVSNMALHHIAHEKKRETIQQIFQSLKPGGLLILNDVYTRQEDRAMLTASGARGPSECKGCPISFGEAFENFRLAGFQFDEVADRAQQDELSITEEDVRAAVHDRDLSMPISNSVWFTILRKEGA